MALRTNWGAKKQRDLARKTIKTGQSARLDETPLQSRRGQPGKTGQACESPEPGA
jgi:hypothetical protein